MEDQTLQAAPAAEAPAEETAAGCPCRHKHREATEYDALIRRLNRIEGQVRGVRGMVEKECYCTDILTSRCPFWMSCTTQVWMWLLKSSREKAFSADWMAETWGRMSVQ